MVLFFTDQDRKEVVERFIRYCKIDTQSKEDVEGNPSPSTQKQFDLAKVLVEELKALGIEVELSEHCYVYATIKENRPTKHVLGLMSHVWILH
jgi:tripeptide aminopeptidase